MVREGFPQERNAAFLQPELSLQSAPAVLGQGLPKAEGLLEREAQDLEPGLRSFLLL